jgi:hypothetical protein
MDPVENSAEEVDQTEMLNAEPSIYEQNLTKYRLVISLSGYGLVCVAFPFLSQTQSLLEYQASPLAASQSSLLLPLLLPPWGPPASPPHRLPLSACFPLPL